MAQRNALGRGLGALIDDAGQEHTVNADSVNEIEINRIEVNPFQPRTKFDEEAFEFGGGCQLVVIVHNPLGLPAIFPPCVRGRGGWPPDSPALPWGCRAG